MNERVRELVKLANRQYSQKYYPKEFLENFAKLIVRECVDVCKSRVGNSDYNTGRMHCVSDLKEHFGVE